MRITTLLTYVRAALKRIFMPEPALESSWPMERVNRDLDAIRRGERARHA